ncbi:MAG: PAS domain-containing protein [Chloroflexi bacterium]|nr:PAS domain-containing protein [Chloroflexota bacterium]
MATKKEQGKKPQPTLDTEQQQASRKQDLGTNSLPVVGVGASAGGLEAFSKFLNNLPKDSGIAFVLVQHLDPSRPSSLPELLGKQSQIPIKEAEEGDRVQPDQAYVIPPGKAMSIRNRTLILLEQPEHPGISHSINLFFRSLAEDVKERAIGIILSGTGSDGTDGAKAIKAQDGLVIVQDPATAAYDGMPRTAIDAGLADYVLAPEAMPARVVDYLRQSFHQRDQVRQSLKKDNPNLKSILSLVKARTGRDFSGYKISSVNRRIEHRMAVNQIERAEDYLRFLRENPAEIENLMKDFLIHVTSFFRDREAFEALKQEMSKTLRAKPEANLLRAWVPGCSSGEEAYSIAMIVLECVQETGQRREVQVFGTDLDAGAISAARTGTYPSDITQDVGPERLERFFSKVDSRYQIEKEVRESVIFAVHDLITDPPYSRMDIVSVRNLLIYFDVELQKKVLPLLHYSLNEGGLLFLGTSETVGELGDFFTTVDSKWRIYRARGKKKALPVSIHGQPVTHETGAVKLSETRAWAGVAPEPLLLLEALPPSVLVDQSCQVLYTHGDTSKYLRMPEGKLSAGLLDLAKPELGSTLATLLHEASQQQKEVANENLQVKYNGGVQPVKITVRPLSTIEGQMVVIFEDLPKAKRRKVKGEPATEAQRQELEQELRRTRDTLRGTIEELRTANEELRSANEEYMSTNEELKSANEELETSREELQSINEELTTLNTESQKKNEELTTLNNDMQNLLNATRIATVFLDEGLRIRRFTPAAARLFKFIDSDMGRPVEDISSPLKDNILVKAARQVLDNLVPVEREVQTTDGRWYGLRILPYRTLDNSIAGVVVSFVDINRIKAALQYAEDIIGNIREPLLVLDDKLRVISASRAFYRVFQVKPEDTEGQLVYELGNHQWDIPQLRTVLREVLKKDTVFEGYRVEHDFPGIGKQAMLLNARRIYDGKASRSILLAIEDVTGRTGLETFSQKKETRNDGG